MSLKRWSLTSKKITITKEICRNIILRTWSTAMQTITSTIQHVNGNNIWHFTVHLDPCQSRSVSMFTIANMHGPYFSEKYGRIWSKDHLKWVQNDRGRGHFNKYDISHRCHSGPSKCGKENFSHIVVLTQCRHFHLLRDKFSELIDIASTQKAQEPTRF